MIRAILFDFNGILVDDEPLHLELFQQVLQEEGVELSAERYYADYLGFDDRGCFTAVLRASGQEIAADRLSRLIARKAAYYQARIRAEGFPFFAGAAELLQEAAASELMLGVVSGALKPEVEGALDQLSLRSAFKVLVTAEDVSEGKPHPEGYLQGLEALNSLPPLPSRLLHPHETLAIEDSPAGIQAAAAAGLSTLGVAHTYAAARLTEADHSIEQLAGHGLANLRAMFA